MSKPILADDLVAQLDDFRRRLEILERTARNPNVSTAASGAQAAEVVPLQTTNSTSYGDLATAGPAVTVNVQQSGLLVLLYGHFADHANNSEAFMAFELSGANTRAPVDADAASLLTLIVGGFSNRATIARAKRLSGLQPGATTVTAKYRLSIGTAAWFGQRWLLALPL